MNRGWPIAIDPSGCGCTECITGEYIPLDAASSVDIRLLFYDRIGNNTGVDIERWLVEDSARIIDRFRKEFVTD